MRRSRSAAASWRVTCVSMGNPHCVVFLTTSCAPVATLGPALEHHAPFPSRVNTEFVRVVDRARCGAPWERGAGETLACGTGACAVVVAATCTAHGRRVSVELPGGELEIEWPRDATCS